MSETENNTFEKGSIVKIKTELIFDKMTKNLNAAPFVYGVLNFVEDACEETNTRAWHVGWAMKHLMIHSSGLEHMTPMLEDDLILVKGPWEMDGRLNRRWCTYHFFEKREDGKWVLRNYTPLCEYCHYTNCDRMEFAEDLELNTEILFEGENLPNNERRKQLY